MAMGGQKFLYYTPWCMSDTAAIACGLSYNGQDSKTQEHKWDRIVNIYIYNVECGTSPNGMMSAWNHQVHLWLKHYVHLRLVTKG